MTDPSRLIGAGWPTATSTSANCRMTVDLEGIKARAIENNGLGYPDAVELISAERQLRAALRVTTSDLNKALEWMSAHQDVCDRGPNPLLMEPGVQVARNRELLARLDADGRTA